MTAQWHRGRWSAAEQWVSPNFCPRPDGERVFLVVLHNISLPPFVYGSGAAARLFANTLDTAADPFFAQLADVRVSAHFVITRCGRTLQFVSCDDMAYHAGVSRFCGRERCNAFSVGIELEGCDFEPFAPAQYAALRALLQALCAAYPITAVCGHQDIAPQRKTDPGHFFDWQRLEDWGMPVKRDV
ncbi:1,6-anhydro-N-acetylmuramyl-L-alanine amidase AmpD [Conchiformibius kuhniae]|uniref:1,6-anhydro-N-acetylmuramyl-L-alanine amidase AmpD n=1 Tax=Conchiformibius kuhniae TaxID=211502 RepID=A0A8T9MVG7_9NEIS|nr:1,6-anhydro-N-acetylmuramyl-L-alanine amidase AmpD [Conchiformibius kuhniae]UOP04132.1 1,6-anhydro-N-acetylmuramyl-L-alanine amidase AmpD [Conchiformibius kuhniae]